MARYEENTIYLLLKWRALHGYLVLNLSIGAGINICPKYLERWVRRFLSHFKRCSISTNHVGIVHSSRVYGVVDSYWRLLAVIARIKGHFTNKTEGP